MTKQTRFLHVLAAVLVLQLLPARSQDGRVTIDLNGTWEFDQTREAFPPQQFTRKIPVPGLIHLAQPRIDQYQVFFAKPEKVESVGEHDVTKLHYEPRYNWYRRTVRVPPELRGKQAVITLLKSMYVTQVYVNRMDVGSSMACYTPVEFPVTHALKYGQENEILVRVGDRAWLPSQAAGSTDKEKVNYLPGIWDDVSLSFTGSFRAHRILMLPSLSGKKVTAKLLIRSFLPSQALYGATMNDSCEARIAVREKISGRVVASAERKDLVVKRDNLTEVAVDIPFAAPHLWTPDDPFLYTAEVTLAGAGGASDLRKVNFGMREFGRQGKHFTLNGKTIILRGTNITLHRFFEDPESEGLAWDRGWVKRLMADIPKELNWNAMRVCVGIAPDFWYDIADESGLLLQNEWLYWQNHGWDDQIRTEYTDWVWKDGNHPSIAIWDAINENWDPFIGNVLIPDLKKLDPTRMWDAGYMTSEQMQLDEMDEPHPYMAAGWEQTLEEYAAHQRQNPYRLGDLDVWPEEWQKSIYSSAAQLVNEYGWIWLWRDGRPAKLTVNQYDHFVGKNATPEERREMQAYWLQLETEWLRSERALGGVLAFCYLANNYGFTGDWFVGAVKDLQPGPTLNWFRHAFAPAAVFIDLVDERYVRATPPHAPGSDLMFNLTGINDLETVAEGRVSLKLLDSSGKTAAEQQAHVAVPAYGKTYVPVRMTLPKQPGGYLLVAEFTAGGRHPVLSRRFINVGTAARYEYFRLMPE
jgi:beta-galactosidase